MKRLLSACGLLILCLLAYAQSARLQPVQDQLSNNSVNALVQDRAGHLWIGTSRGLNRFNGSAYKPYLNLQADSLDLFDDYVSALAYDTGERLWVGTPSGIALLRGDRVDPKVRWEVGRVFSLASLDEQHLLCSVRNALSIVDKTTGENRPVFHDDRLAFNSFKLTGGGYVWIDHLTRPDITVLDPSFRIVREISRPGENIRGIWEAYDRHIYVCTDKGLFKYMPDGTPAPLPAFLETLTRGENVLFFQRRPDAEMMVLGIQGKGIYAVRPEQARHIVLQEDLEDCKTCLALLAEENIWLSHNRQGLEWHYLPSDRESILIPENHPSEALNNFYEKDAESLLILTNKDIYTYQRARREMRRVQAEGINGDDQITISLIDQRGRLWLVYGFRELRRYEWNGDRLVIAFRCPVQASVSIWNSADGRVHLLQGDKILTVDREDKVTTLPASAHPPFWYSGQTRSGLPYFLADDSIWVSRDNLILSNLDIDVKTPVAFYEDVDGTYWIGSSREGLFHYDPSEKKVESVPYGNEQTDRSIRSLTGDPYGNIWVASRTDVTMISNKDGSAVSYKSLPGLSGVMATNNSLVGRDRTVYFGSVYRIFSFLAVNPEMERDIPLEMDGIIVNGSTLVSGVPDELVLSHKETQLAFYFSAVNFDTNFRPVYQYRLEGYDSGWNAAGDGRRVGYSGLPPGSYTFRVRVQRPDGKWSADELVQRVRIRPSPWLSWPMLLLYGLLVAAAVVAAIYLYVRSKMDRERLDLTAQEKLLVEQMSQERTTFFTNVSHEFRTPLALIYGPVKELARSTTLGEKDRKLVGVVERNSERMIRLTDQLLQFNQSAVNRDELSVERTDLAAVLRKMLENFEYMFRQKNLAVHLDAPAMLDAYCDREKVERIVFNLVSNAVKYTPERGRIEVSLTTDGQNASIGVADTGIGITPEKMSRIFNRYERVGEKVGGTLPSGFGIGLNYARHLAEVHKGSLSVRSNDPIGTIFTFTFPFGKEAYSAEAIWEENAVEKETEVEETGAVMPEGPAEVNVLVVEDNADMREYIRSFLAPFYNVMTAEDGEQAWKCIRISAPDLIVSDVMMPYKDGYTLCKEIKNDPEFCHLPVLLLTAKADMENHIHGLELGADAYIGKPFDPQFLLASVANLLENRRRMQQELSEKPSAVENMHMNTHDKLFMEKLYALVEQHLGEEDFNVTTMALELGMSRTSLFSKLKALLGQSPQTFLLGYRLNRAMQLLKEGELNVSEVAYKVGFSTLTGFSRSFKNKFGVPPSSV